ncbi:MAG: DEAD/DEAH box helicase [Armatimonadetes bacterium]|nr:DEAD/DEAH box helicase [Armatimonadota bacterium]
MYAPGTLVYARERHWVVLPSDDELILRLRPLGGTDEEICGIYLPLERNEISEAQFPLPDPNATGTFADIVSARLLWNAARLMLRDGAGPFRCLGKLSFRPRPYQFVPLMMALRLNPIRLFIADDVGIGKTIEAALIARELLDRGEIKRICVLCPPYLCEQWQKELWEKFHIPAVVIRSGTVSRLEREVPSGESIFGYFQAIVVSIDYAKMERHRDNFLLHCPEFVIVDEAHGAAQPPGQNRNQQLRHELLKAVAQKENRHIVLLTATPHSGVEQSFRSLLAILNPEFGKYELSKLDHEQRDKLALHFIQRRRGDVKKWLGEETRFPERDLLEVTYNLSEPYRQLFLEVYKFARGLIQRGDQETGWRKRLCYWNALALLRCVMSSPAAAERTLMAHGAAISGDEESSEEGYDPTIFDPMEREAFADTEPSHRVSELERSHALLSDYERQRLREFAKKASQLKHTQHDTKLTELVKVIRQLLRDGFHPIVWCRYIATADYVAEGLRRNLPETVTVYSVTGALPEDERIRRVEELAKYPKRVLVATDCLSEGINLQENFTAVVHYDLPWNPNRLEQRDGRVDRFGQPAEKVKSVLIYGRDNPIDGVVLKVLLQKAREIYRTTGVAVPVPGDSESVTEAIVRALLLRFAAMPSLEQLALFELPEVTDLHQRWEWVAQREKESRTKFAQRALKPEEVERELREMDRVLGDPDAVRKFVADACQRLEIPLKQLKDDIWELQLNSLREPIKERMNMPADKLPSNGIWQITFTSPPPENADYIGRNHPLVTALATYLLEKAIDNDENSPARRCGALVTDAVDTLTSIFILHLRFLLQEEGKPPLLAEEGLVIGAKGLTEVHWIETEEALRLLDSAVPTRDISKQEQADWVQEALNLWEERQDEIKQIVERRAKALQEAHRRVRRLLKEAPVTVKPHRPELLAVYVLVPHR